MFFGLKSIKDAWDLPQAEAKNGEESGIELGEYTEAEELVKEKASKKLTNPLEILWKSFSLVFFAVRNFNFVKSFNLNHPCYYDN